VELVLRAVALFAATNVDDLMLLTLFLGTAGVDRAARRRVVVGQYLGFAAILGLSVLGAAGAELLPGDAVPYLGLVPLLLGVREVVRLRRRRRDDGAVRPDDSPSVRADDSPSVRATGPVSTWSVAAVTVANGADNVGVYVPAFAAASAAGVAVTCAIFLVGVAVLCAVAGRLGGHPAVARAIARWGHLALPAVLIGLGLLILVEGGAFGL